MSETFFRVGNSAKLSSPMYFVRQKGEQKTIQLLEAGTVVMITEIHKDKAALVEFSKYTYAVVDKKDLISIN